MYFLLFFSCSNNTYEPIAPDSNDMVLITSSSETEEISFSMGFPDVEPGPYGNSWKETAQPQHQVTLSPFYIDRTEVTVNAYVDMLNQLHVSTTNISSLVHPLMPITYDESDETFTILDGYERHPMDM